VRVTANGLQLAYDTFGREDDPAILLIMGLGNQLIDWPDALCAELARAGRYVVRFDNRDVGLSDRITRGRRPNLITARLAQALGLPQRPAYTLDDMARDTVGLMDALNLSSAHLVGISMGGMIAQLVALNHPSRVVALTLMMTHSGARWLPGPDLDVVRQMIRRPARRDREGLLRHSVRTWNLIGSPGYPQTEHQRYRKVQRGFDRAFNPAGVLRQMHAIMAAPSRCRRLAALTVPTLVLHGEADRLVPVACGRNLAQCIPDARLVTIPGWGHDLPPQLLPRLSRAILAHPCEQLATPSSETGPEAAAVVSPNP
jgi:pimeloyl-ACP methyl ester carboxylesterase